MPCASWCHVRVDEKAGLAVPRGVRSGDDFLPLQFAQLCSEGLCLKSEDERRERAALCNPAFDWEGICEVAIVSDPRLCPLQHDAHLALCSGLEAQTLDTSVHPFPVDPIEGFLEIQEQHTAGQLDLLHVVHLFQVEHDVISDLSAGEESCLRDVDDCVERDRQLGCENLCE